MEWIGDAVTNATLHLVLQVESRYEQSEQIATVAVGVAVGVVVSALLMACLCLCSRARAFYKRRANMKEVCCSDEPQSPAYSGSPAATPVPEHTSLDTEGAYRSDSDADDEGQGRRIDRAAQRLSRGEGSV